MRRCTHTLIPLAPVPTDPAKRLEYVCFCEVRDYRRCTSCGRIGSPSSHASRRWHWLKYPSDIERVLELARIWTPKEHGNA